MRKDVHTYSTAELRRWGLDTGFRTPEVRAIMLQGYVGDQLGRVADALEAMAPAARNGAGDVVGRTLSVAAALRHDGGGAPEPAALGEARAQIENALMAMGDGVYRDSARRALLRAREALG